MNKLQVLTIQFSLHLAQYEIPMFRSAILNVVGDDAQVLFHNHIGEGFRYSYPLIQYKSIHRQAALVCVKDGTEAIGELFSRLTPEITIGKRTEKLEVTSMKANQYLVQLWDTPFTYRMRNWMPLSQDNYPEYQKLEGVAEKVSFLENILFGNILSFCKGINLIIDKPSLSVKIISIGDSRISEYKGVKMTNFDVEFKTNISLPDYIGLGKGSSMGHGVVIQKRQRKEE